MCSGQVGPRPLGRKARCVVAEADNRRWWLRSARGVIRPAPSGRDQRVRQSSTGASSRAARSRPSRIAPQAVTGFEMDSTRKERVGGHRPARRRIGACRRRLSPDGARRPRSARKRLRPRTPSAAMALGYDTRQPIRNAAIGNFEAGAARRAKRQDTQDDREGACAHRIREIARSAERGLEGGHEGRWCHPRSPHRC